MASLDTTATLNNQSIDITVFEDVDNTGTIDNTETVSIGDGTNSYTLSNISADTGNAVWIRPEHSGTDITSGASLASAEIVAIVIPPAPTNLTITDSSIENELSLGWDNVSDEDGYYVYRAESSGSTKTDYTQVADLAADTTSYTDTSLEDGERYFYRVSAYSTDGESDLSNEADSTTVLPLPDSLSLDDSVSGELTISWTKNDDSSDGSFEVDRAPLVGTNWSTIATGISPTTTSYTDTTISDETEYKYRVARDTGHKRVTSGDKPYRYYPRVTIV